jgi:hypothetical protein
MSFIRTAALALSLVLISVAGAACNKNGDSGTATAPRGNVSVLHVALQEGFDNDRVLISLNDKSIYDKAAVTTDLRIGRADAVEVPLEEGALRLQVSLPDRDLSGSIVIRGKDTVYVGVSMSNGEMQFTVSHEPFGYL